MSSSVSPEVPAAPSSAAAPGAPAVPPSPASPGVAVSPAGPLSAPSAVVSVCGACSPSANTIYGVLVRMSIATSMVVTNRYRNVFILEKLRYQ